MPEPRVEPADLRAVWDDLRPRLEALKARFGADWRPEDIYAQVLAGRYTLYHDPGNPGNYCVMQIREHLGVKEVFVWIVVGEGEVIKRYQPLLDELTRQVDAERLAFESPRKGFLQLDGWSAVQTLYHRYV